MAVDFDVPVGLAGLFRPSEAEVAAARFDRPFLVGAYGLDRIAGRNQIERMGQEANALRMALALRKMQAERDKDLLHYLSQTQVLERFDRPEDILKRIAPELDLPPSVPGLPAAIQAQKRKPSGGINLGTDTEVEKRLYLRDPKTGQEFPYLYQDKDTDARIKQGYEVVERQSRSVRKVQPGVPTPPANAAPDKPTAALKPPPGAKAGDPVIGPDGKPMLGPNGRPLEWR